MKHHILLLATLLALNVQSQVQDYTTTVKNTTTAWGATGTYKAGSTTLMEYYSSQHFYHGTFAQTVTGLPVGVYQAEVYFNASCAAWDCAEVCTDGSTGRTHLYINDAEVDVPVRNIKQIDEPTLYTIKDIHVTDGTLRLGARNDREGANWHLIRLKSLKYLGTDSRSLYDAQFPLIRKARLALAASTCPGHRQLLQQAIDESLVASAHDSADRLQALYDNIATAIRESESFEKDKASKLKSLVSRLGYFQRIWNKVPENTSTEQWQVLLPAVERACIAKDSECDIEPLDEARLALNNAMTQATGICVPHADATQHSLYTIDGRKASSAIKGILIDDHHKRFTR